VYTFILIFHQLVCGPDLGLKMDVLRKQDPAMNVTLVLGHSDWTSQHCVFVERRVQVPTFSAEL